MSWVWGGEGNPMLEEQGGGAALGMHGKTNTMLGALGGKAALGIGGRG